MKITVPAGHLVPGDLVVGIANCDWHFPPDGVRVVSVEVVEKGMGILILWEGEGKRKELWPFYEDWFVETDEEQEQQKKRYSVQHPKFCIKHNLPGEPCSKCDEVFGARIADPIASEMAKLLEPEVKPEPKPLTKEEFEEQQRQARIAAPAQTHSDQVTTHYVHAKVNPQMADHIRTLSTDKETENG